MSTMASQVTVYSLSTAGDRPFPYRGCAAATARLSDGTYIMLDADAVSEDILFYYSDDDGDTWSLCTTKDTSATNLAAAPMDYRDAPGVWIADDDTIHYCAMFYNGTKWAMGWGFASFSGTDVTVTQSLTDIAPSDTSSSSREWATPVVIEDPNNSSKWRLICSAKYNSSSYRLYEATANKTGGSLSNVQDTQITTQNAVYTRIAMEDDGDARTPANSTPDISLMYVGTSNTARKNDLTWNGTTNQYDKQTSDVSIIAYPYVEYFGYDAVNSKFFSILNNNVTPPSKSTYASHYWAHGATSVTAGPSKAGIEYDSGYSNTRLSGGGWHPDGYAYIANHCGEPTGGWMWNVLDVTGGWATATFDSVQRMMGLCSGTLGTEYYAWQVASPTQDYTSTEGYFALVLHGDSGNPNYYDKRFFYRIGPKWGYNWFTATIQGATEDGRVWDNGINSNAHPMFGAISSLDYEGYYVYTVDMDAVTINKAIHHNIPTANTGTATSLHTELRFEDADDASRPTSWTDWDGRNRTTANTQYDPSSFPTNSNLIQFTVTSLVQEVLDRGGWANGNDMMVMYENDTTTGTNYLIFIDQNTHESPWLYIDWAAAVDLPYWGILLQ